MTSFQLRSGERHAEAVSLATIAANVGTPAYGYSADALRRSEIRCSPSPARYFSMSEVSRVSLMRR